MRARKGICSKVEGSGGGIECKCNAISIFQSRYYSDFNSLYSTIGDQVAPSRHVYDDFLGAACCNPEADGLVIPVTVIDGGSRMSGEMDIYFYTLHGIVSRPLILRALDREYYLVLQQNEEVYFALVHTMIMGVPLAPESFVMSLRVFPLMNVIWLGVILMCVGIVFPLYRLRRT